MANLRSDVVGSISVYLLPQGPGPVRSEVHSERAFDRLSSTGFARYFRIPTGYGDRVNTLTRRAGAPVILRVAIEKEEIVSLGRMKTFKRKLAEICASVA